MTVQGPIAALSIIGTLFGLLELYARRRARWTRR